MSLPPGRPKKGSHRSAKREGLPITCFHPYRNPP